MLRFWLKCAFETLFQHTNSFTPPQNIKNKVEFIPSGGEDVWYARAALWIYRVFSPYPLYWLTKYYSRREVYKSCHDGTVKKIADKFIVTDGRDWYMPCELYIKSGEIRSGYQLVDGIVQIRYLTRHYFEHLKLDEDFFKRIGCNYGIRALQVSREAQRGCFPFHFEKIT